MPRPLRFVPERSLVEITTRTFQGRMLLRPSPELTDIILGIIGKAQELYGAGEVPEFSGEAHATSPPSGR